MIWFIVLQPPSFSCVIEWIKQCHVMSIPWCQPVHINPSTVIIIVISTSRCIGCSHLVQYKSPKLPAF